MKTPFLEVLEWVALPVAFPLLSVNTETLLLARERTERTAYLWSSLS
jgi:hypothetical protein